MSTHRNHRICIEGFFKFLESIEMLGECFEGALETDGGFVFERLLSYERVVGVLPDRVL